MTFKSPAKLQKLPKAGAKRPLTMETDMSATPFDQRDGWIWYDGQFVPWKDAKVHVLTHGLHYGSSVFEGERAYGGTVFKSREHSERLKKSGEILDFEIPYTAAEIDAAK